MLYIISAMNTKRSLRQLERQIGALQEKLCALGPMHPGSVSRQYQVCGNPACRCMHPQRPQRHGPYYKLAYVHRGKPTCRFVRADCVAELKQRPAAGKYPARLMLVGSCGDDATMCGIVEEPTSPFICL